MKSRGPLYAALAAVAFIGAGAGVGYLTSRTAETALAKAARDYAGSGAVGKAWADSLRVASQALRARGKIPDAQAAEATAFKSARELGFQQLVQPQLNAIVPEGADLEKDEAARGKLADALDRMADAVHPLPKEPVRGPPEGIAHLLGWTDHAARRAQLADSLPHRTLSHAAPALVAPHQAEPAGAEKKDVFLFKAWREVLGQYPDYPAQQIGDCTSFGSSHAVDLLQCIDLALTGGTKEQYRETSTEVTYGLGREIAGMLGGGDGCYGVAVAKALTDIGALPREKVGPYSGQRAKQYGRSGVPADFKALAKDHKLGAATLVTTLDEADAALENSYPFIVCSNQGFAMTRDADGLCEARGSWAHCMFVAGARTRNGERQYLVCQSWGSKTPSGPTTDEQPPFSFWVRGKVMARMLAAQDSLAFSRFAGFVARPVPERWTYSGFAKPAPKLRKAG